MSSHYLPIYGANAADDAEDLVARLNSNTATVDDIRRLSKFYRISGIAVLLAEADAQRFQTALVSSAERFLSWLDLEHGTVAALSHCDALLDAVAANHWTLAQTLAQRLQHVEWSEAREYEEDFLSFSLLRSALADSPGEREVADSLLRRYGELEADDVDWRLELWRALHQGEGEEFEVALEGLLLQTREHFDYLREKDALPPEELATLANISIEGIVMRRLGERAGFALQPDYLFVPSLALDIIAR